MTLGFGAHTIRFMNIKIDKDFPVPPKSNSGLITALRSMSVGDSFLVPEGVKRNTVNSSSTYCRPFRFVTRTTIDGLRVWRTE